MIMASTVPYAVAPEVLSSPQVPSPHRRPPQRVSVHGWYVLAWLNLNGRFDAYREITHVKNVLRVRKATVLPQYGVRVESNKLCVFFSYVKPVDINHAKDVHDFWEGHRHSVRENLKDSD